MTQELAKNITVDYDASTIIIDGESLPYLIQDGPVVSANVVDEQPGVLLRILASEVTVRGVPTQRTPAPPATITVRLWDKDWNFLATVDEGWRRDEPGILVLDGDHPIATHIVANRGASLHLTVDADGHRWTGTLREWERTRGIVFKALFRDHVY